MAAEAKAPELELWNAAVCPFGQRAWWTILEKGVSPDTYTINWENIKDDTTKSDSFKAAYAQARFRDPKSVGKTPTVRYGDKYITESDISSRFLDKTLDGPSLLPNDILDEITMFQVVGKVFGPLIKNFMGAIINKLKGQDAEATEAGNNLLQALVSLENELNNISKEGYLFGETFTLFEIFVFPVFFRFEAAEEITGIPILSKWLNADSGCDESKQLTRVINWYNKVNSRDTVTQMKTISTKEVIIAGYDKFKNA